MRYSFVDGAGDHLVDGDFEYVLRREGDALRCHIGVNISAEPHLTALAESRGLRGPVREREQSAIGLDRQTLTWLRDPREGLMIM